ncbi:acyltransferase [Dactylosporangium sp. NBC_01737]|uniref:acyltransferase family protein n=1 Tax=Dactylosporangium sp. NBC_01737 TaxID=2975959 RepID=UPI002E12165F|nr:acyltransferase [Dactylosporangium sp. NBC_01737]
MNRDSRLPALTGLRWAAALVVFGQHTLELFYDPDLVAPRPVRAALWALLVNGGAMGVSFFFVLSGFVLTWSSPPAFGVRGFWWRRFSKIYPATLVTTLAALLVVGGAGPLQLAAHLTLTQTWFPHASIFGALNPVSWSLSCEAFFYLCFPLLLAFLRRLRPGGLWTVAALLVTGVLATGVLLTTAQRPFALWFGYMFPPVRMAEFALGIVVALLIRAGAWRGPGLRWSFVLVALGAAAALKAPYPLNQHALTLVPVTLAVAAAARADLTGVPTIWTRPLLRYLGEVSFAFYLVHYLTYLAYERLGLLPHHAHPLVAALVTVSVFSISLLGAMAVYHCVELPALRLLRRRAVAPPTSGDVTVEVPLPAPVR